MTAPHTPITDLHQTRIEYPSCEWRQLLDEDLHEGYTAELIAWHQAHPEKGIDHLTATEGLQGGLGIAEYVRWTDDGLGCLAVGDERTGYWLSPTTRTCSSEVSPPTPLPRTSLTSSLTRIFEKASATSRALVGEPDRVDHQCLPELSMAASMRPSKSRKRPSPRYSRTASV
jgi:hypothetical protein